MTDPLLLLTAMAVGAVVLCAVLVLFTGEALLERIPTVRRFRSLRSQWSHLSLDINKVLQLKKFRQKQSQKDGGEPFLDPSRLNQFCSLGVGETICGSDLQPLSEHEKLRPISDLIHVVAYPVARLGRLTHELQVYAGFLLLLFVLKIAAVWPALAPRPRGLREALQRFVIEVGAQPFAFLDTLKFALIVVFGLRLASELIHLRHYTKGSHD
jgi:hypothetical protein